MNKRKKLVILAVSLIVAGLVIGTAGLYAADFDFSRMTLARLTANIHGVDTDFTKISIDTAISDVRLELSTDGSCQVVCQEEVNYTHKVSVEHNTLSITTEDNRMWYEKIGIQFENFHSVTVRLPKEAYEELTVNCRTADVEIPRDFSFGWAEITTTTGDIKWQGSLVNDLLLSVSTGDIYVDDTASQNLTAKTGTGDIRLSHTGVSQSFVAKTGTGDVRFESFNCKAMSVRTDTGDVTGSLLSNMFFVTKAGTGDVKVPDLPKENNNSLQGELVSVDGNTITIKQGKTLGYAEITTGTGDIRIEYALDS